MQAFADYHTHTTYSHGKGSIEDNVQAALTRGLKTVGISDHGPGHFFIGVRGVAAFRKMQEEVRQLQKKYPQIEILLSMEANIVDPDGTIDVQDEILRELDMLLVGYHKLVKPRSVHAFFWILHNFISGWFRIRSQKLRARNTHAICEAVRRYPVRAITHPGLQIDIDTVELAHVCKEHGTWMEINSSYGTELEGYVKTALPVGVQFVMNSDAHVPERVGEFSAAYELAERLQVPHERIVNLKQD